MWEMDPTGRLDREDEMAQLTLIDAERIAARGKPWTIRLEFTGANSANANGFSDKYWYATGRALKEMVEAGWGANGAGAQHQLIDWAELRKRVAEKLAKGYTYVDTPYTRMTPASLAKLGGPTPSGGHAPVATPAPVVVTTPPVVLGTGTVLAPGVTVKSVTLAPAGPAAVARTPALLALGDPWALTNHLKVLRSGTSIVGWAAIDDNGDETGLRFDPDGGRQFAVDYDLELVLG